MPRVAMALAITFALVIVVFHVLRPDVDPIARGVSRYGAGRYGEVFNAVSLVLAVAFVVTGLGFRQAAPDSAALGVYLLWLGAAGMVFVAVFPLRAADSMAVENLPHQVGGAIFFVAAAAAPVLLSRSGGRHGTLAWGVAVATVVFFLSVGVPALTGIRGLLQRVCFGAIVTWLVAANASLPFHDVVKRP